MAAPHAINGDVNYNKLRCRRQPTTMATTTNGDNNRNNWRRPPKLTTTMVATRTRACGSIGWRTCTNSGARQQRTAAATTTLDNGRGRCWLLGGTPAAPWDGGGDTEAWPRQQPVAMTTPTHGSAPCDKRRRQLQQTAMPSATDNYGNNDKRRQQPQQLATTAKADDNYGDGTNP